MVQVSSYVDNDDDDDDDDGDDDDVDRWWSMMIGCSYSFLFVGGAVEQGKVNSSMALESRENEAVPPIKDDATWFWDIWNPADVSRQYLHNARTLKHPI